MFPANVSARNYPVSQNRTLNIFTGEDLGLSGGQALEGGEPIQAFKEDEAEIPVAASGPNYAAFGTEEVQGMTSGMSGMTMREEPECIKKWKLEQEEMLKKKDADEEVKI